MKLFSHRSASPVSHGYSLIDEQLSVAGDLASDGTVRVEGRVEGARHRVGKLIVGAGGTLVGDVDAHEIVVAGTLAGNVRVSGRVEIQASATVRGDVHAASVMLHDGGSVHGHLVIQAVDADRPAAEARRLAATGTARTTPAIAAAAQR